MYTDISEFKGVENLKGEIWRKIPDFKGYYVSNVGRIISINRNKNKPLVMKKHHDKDRYERITLFDHTKNDYTFCFVHQLVLFAFVGPKLDGMETSHLNHKRDDNRLCNLRWETASENQRRRVENRTDMRGENSPLAKLTNEDVFNIRKLYLDGQHSFKEIDTLYNITGSSYIIKLKTWAYTKLPYNLSKKEYLKKVYTQISKNTHEKTKHLGENNKAAHLTWEEVEEIRKIHKDKLLSYSQISKKYKISLATVWRVVKQVHWKEKNYE